MNKCNFWLFFFLLWLSACTAPSPPEFRSQPVLYHEYSKDVRLEIPAALPQKITPPSGQVASADLFRHLRVLQSLDSHYPDATWGIKSKETIFRFYESPQTHTKIGFKDSPFAEFFIAKSEPLVKQEILRLPEFFSRQKILIRNVIQQTTLEFSFPQSDLTIEAALGEIGRYLSAFEDQLRRSEAHNGVKRAILEKIYRQFWLKSPEIAHKAASLQQSSNLSHGVNFLKDLLGEIGVELDAQSANQLSSAEMISARLEGVKDEQAIFTLFSEIWDAMNESERRQTFGQMSKELYDFFESKNRAPTVCMKIPDCPSFLFAFKRSFFVLPSIKSHGVARLKAQVEAAAVESLKSKTGQMASEMLKSLPAHLQQLIFSEMDHEANRYARLAANYKSFAREQLQGWFLRQFSRSDMPALERTHVSSGWLSSSPKAPISSPSDSAMEVGAETLGAALSGSAPLFISALTAADRPRARLLALVRINQMLAHGGFLMSDGSSYPALRRSLRADSEITTPMNIESSLTPVRRLAVPSGKIDGGFGTLAALPSRRLEILAEARLLEGFSELTLLFKDWAPSPMSELIGNIKVSELLPEIEDQSLDRPAIPNEAFLAIGLGNASAILANLQAKGSPAFVVCSGSKVLFIDENSACPEPSAVAGLVDIIDGRRADRAHLRGQVAFLEGLLSFLEMADQIKRSQSPYLVKAEPGVIPPVLQLQESLPKIRGLAIGLTNFITSTLQDEAGGFAVNYNLSTGRVSVERAPLADRLRAIRSVARAAQHLHFRGYAASALAGYYALNRELWNPNLGFYADAKDPQISAIELALAVNTLRPLLKFEQDPFSRDQLRRLLALWVRALMKAA